MSSEARSKERGVVLAFWNEPVSVMMPVKRSVAMSSSRSFWLNSFSRRLKTGKRSSVVDAAMMSTRLILPKWLLEMWWSILMTGTSKNIWGLLS